MAANIGFTIIPVSPNPRDDELHIPFPGLHMTPNYRPVVGTLLRDMKFDSIKPELSQLGDMVLTVINGGSPDATLIFARKTLPSRDLEASPSESFTKRKPFPWPNVVRSVGIRHMLKAGDYVGTIVSIDEVAAGSRVTKILTERWWTSEPWPEDLMRHNNAEPGIIRWDYPLARGTRNCLHREITMPPLSAVWKMNGRETANANRPSWTYPATEHVTWTKHVFSDDQNKVRGRWFRERQTAFPPYDALKFPKPPVQVTS